MDLAGFRAHLEASRPMLDGWGRYVKNLLLEFARLASVSVQLSSHRVKETDSAIGKIARKNYKDPLKQMHDLVGVRLVVLLSPEIEIICKLIESCDKWSYTKDRDPDAESQANPDKFGYQSVHYVVRAKNAIEIDGVAIPPESPCEIQVRTLLQHAYAELVHDSIYKAVGPVPHKASRYAASSMALIETTDHLFCETMRLLEEENSARNQLLEELKSLYDAKIGSVDVGFDDKLNLFVLDQFRDKIPDDVTEKITSLVDANTFIVQQIRDRMPYDPFWSQPVSLLAYWLVQTDGKKAFDAWPLASSHDALEKIYSDLGISLH